MSKKGFIILLVILAVLYIASLGMGVAINSSDEADLDKLKRRAGGKIGALFEAFADRLELRGLQCNGEAVAGSFTLNFSGGGRESCELVFNPDLEDDDDYVKTELRLAPRPAGQASGGAAATPTVYLDAGFTEKEFPKSERDEARCKLEGEKLDAFRLEVRYTPSDEPKTDWSCSLEQDLPLSLTVTRGGGTLALTLVCDECGNRDTRKAALRMK